MTVHNLTDKEGRVFAFEIPNIGRDRLCKILASFPEARMIRKPTFLSEFREWDFCEFEVAGQKFTASEAFGDSSEYWIGPEPAQWCEQVAIVRDYFARHE